MTPRLDYQSITPEVRQAILAMDQTVQASGLEPSLVELVKVRVSQINGCAFCLDMHTKNALLLGITPQRLFTLSAWRETPFYTDRERAALAWAEEVTTLDKSVPDAIYEQARLQFSERELILLTLAVIAINSWNRLAISMRTTPGTYRPDLA